jgi:hypothetical protein
MAIYIKQNFPISAQPQQVSVATYYVPNYNPNYVPNYTPNYTPNYYGDYRPRP